MYIVSHKSEYTPNISAKIVVKFLKGQYHTNETWIYFRVVNVQSSKYNSTYNHICQNCVQSVNIL